MTFSHSQYVAIIQHTLEKQGKKKDLAAAIRESNAPKHMVPALKEFLEKPVEIRDPAILKEDRGDKLELCVRPDGSFPERFFPEFRAFLLDHRRWDKDVIGNLSETSIKLVTRLPKPAHAEKFQYRGLVVGHIQSGKTASMAALIARSADQGYKLFIIMSGLYHDLRSQTQTRLDQEITGETDNPLEKPTVTHGAGANWGRLTKSGLLGEFSEGTISARTVLGAEGPKLAVIKKNVRVLERLFSWLRNSGMDLVKLPALVIDDEADQASINTNANRTDEYGDPIDPSKTNQRINDLLRLLPKCAYVGYTATPFANVLIDSETDDLYPRDFIAVLPEPAGYLGPRQLFGLGMSASEMSPEEPQPAHYSVIRNVTEEQLDEADKPNPAGDVPALIKDSILSYLLGCCVRMERGQKGQHFSMLVHPSVNTVDHMRYADVIRKEVQYIKDSLRRPKQFKELAARARKMWEEDFRPTTLLLPKGKSLVRKFDGVWEYAKSIADQIEVKVLNSGSDDVIDYEEPPKRYIVVGGARLSRGLTLQGLSVSVFLRSSKDYDTLLQMGRWFGYRKGYEDLTRIYVEGERAEDFADLARIEYEMREDLKKYASEPDPPSPREIFPRIRSHHRLAITSLAKRGAGQAQNASFAGKLGQTVSFPFDEPHLLRENETIVRAWLEDLGKPRKSSSKNGTFYWMDVKPGEVLELLKAYRFSKSASIVQGKYLSTYIRFQNSKSELMTWDVVIPKGSSKLGPYKWTDGLTTYKVRRALVTEKSIGVLSDPRDQEAWAKELGRNPSDRKRGALYLYSIDANELRIEAQRRFRKKLPIQDVVGLVLQFPDSGSAATTEYYGQGGERLE